MSIFLDFYDIIVKKQREIKEVSDVYPVKFFFRRTILSRLQNLE